MTLNETTGGSGVDIREDPHEVRRRIAVGALALALNVRMIKKDD